MQARLQIRPPATRAWGVCEEIDGKVKLLTIGPYPDISLQEARMAQKKLLREGKEPKASATVADAV